MLNIPVSSVVYPDFLISYKSFITESMILARDISMIFLWVVVIDFVIYLILSRYERLLKIVKCIFLTINICVFLIDLFTIYFFQFPLNSTMIEVLSVSNVRESGEFAQTYGTNVQFWLFIAFVGVLLFMAWQLFKLISRKKILLFLILITGASLGVYAARNEVNVGKGYERFLSSLAPVRLIYMASSFYIDKMDLQQAMNTNTPVIITKNESSIPYFIYIVGESGSRNHMSLYGYYLETSPLLSKRKDIYIFDDVVSPHASTVAVLKKLFCFYDYESSGNWYDYQSLFNILNAAGYYTVWLSNHERRPGWDPRTVYSSQCAYRDFPDKFKGSQYHSDTYDEKLLPLIDEFLSIKHDKKFLAVELLGSHYHCYKRYPKEFAKFTAKDEKNSYTTLTESQKQNRAEYDNSILYNDYVVNEIIKRFENENAIIIYAPDHSAEVYDSMNFTGDGDGIRSAFIIEIPFLVFTSNKFRESYPDLDARIKSSVHRPYMTDDVIHTILDILGIATPDYNPAKSIINENFDAARKRMYFKYEYIKGKGLIAIQ